MRKGTLGRLLDAVFGRRADATVPEYVHAELGVFRLNVEEDWWEARIDLPAGEYRRAATVTVLIAGTEHPDDSLIERALDIVRSFPAFQSRIEAFLSGCAHGPWFGYETEIDALVVESINLLWPNKPEHAMIYFEGGLDGRVWRCDWVAGTPRDLGFDS